MASFVRLITLAAAARCSQRRASLAYVLKVSATGSYACVLAVRYLQQKFAGSLSFLKLIVHPLCEANSDMWAATLRGCSHYSRAVITGLNMVTTFLTVLNLIILVYFGPFKKKFKSVRVNFWFKIRHVTTAIVTLRTL